MNASADQVLSNLPSDNCCSEPVLTTARPAHDSRRDGVDAAEISHRMKNLVAVIQSISRLTMRHCSSMAEFKEKFSSRLSSLCVALDQLIANDWQAMPIHHQVRAQLENFGISEAQIFTEGPNVFLTPEGAHQISLALHELSTNAMKHGALSVPHGHVKLTWSVSDLAGQARFQMAWREIDGPPVREPSRHGFGRLLLEECIGSALGGSAKCAFPTTGFRWELDVPQVSALAFAALNANVGAEI